MSVINHLNESPRYDANRLGIGSLIKPPREMLETEHHLNLPRPPPMVGRSKVKNMERFCEYHGEKGHLTNDCNQLKKQLEIALNPGNLTI